MKIDEIVADAAADMSSGRTEIGPVLLWVIEQVVVTAITWFIQNHNGDINKAITEFLNFFKNLNFWNSLRWNLKVRQISKKYKNVDVEDRKMARSVSRKFAVLDETTVRALFEEVVGRTNS